MRQPSYAFMKPMVKVCSVVRYPQARRAASEARASDEQADVSNALHIGRSEPVKKRYITIFGPVCGDS